MVHGQNKTGEISEKAHEEEGPRFRGFLLHVDFHAERPVRAVEIPQDLRRPYWTTFVNDYAIGTGKDAGFASTSLSCNHGTDRELFEKLKASLAADENAAAIPAVPDKAAQAQPKVAAKDDSPPALKDFASRFTQLLKTDCPEAEITMYDNDLVARYRTQKFMIHGPRNKTGEISENAREEEGPKFRGFLLRVHFHSEPQIRQGHLPSHREETYWKTFANEYVIGSGRDAGFAYARLSYNPGIDPQLLEKLKPFLTADDTLARFRAEELGAKRAGNAEGKP